MFRRVSMIMICACMPIALWTLAPVGLSAAPTKEFKIGYSMPISGTVAQWGASNLKGATLAIEEINAAGGVAGHKLVLLSADDKGVPTEAMNVAERFVSRDKVDVLAGTVMSSGTIAMLEVVKRHKIPFVVPTSTAPQITAPDSPTKGYVFRLVPTNDIMADQLAEYCLGTLGLKSIALVTDVANEWSMTLRDCFTKSMAKYPQAQVVASESIQGGETNFYSVLAKVKARKPDGVFVNMQINEAITFVRQAKEVGLATQLFAAQGCSDPSFVRGAGDAANGMIALSFYEPSNILNPVSKSFTESFYAKHKAEGLEPGLYEAQAYDAIYVIADALRRAEGDKTKFLSALKNTKGLQGVIGVTTFDENGQVQKLVLMIRIVDGKKVVIG